jgi:hypothetical protein
MLPTPQHRFVLFELDFDVKFPLLRLLIFLSDLKSTILSLLEIVKDVTKEIIRRIQTN